LVKKKQGGARENAGRKKCEPCTYISLRVPIASKQKFLNELKTKLHELKNQQANPGEYPILTG
jgi:hypothetical protein